MIALCFQVNVKVSERGTKRVSCLVTYEVLIWCLGRKQSIFMSVTSPPSQLDLEVSSICIGSDVRWSLLHLRCMSKVEVPEICLLSG